MKTPRLIIIVLSILTLTSASALSQEYYPDKERDGQPRQRQQIPEAGPWPTEVMMERIIDRLVDRRMAAAFGFDDDQTYNTQELAKERLIPWLQENRPELQRVTNEFIEAWLDGRPPSKKWVADWAQQALPLLDGFVEQVETAGEDLRVYLTEDQQTLLDANLAGMRAATSLTTRRLGGWAAGKFDPRTDWHRSPAYAKAQGIRDGDTKKVIDDARADVLGPSAAGAAGAGPAAGQAAPAPPSAANTVQPKDAWTAYVEDFIRRYELNADQQSKAYKHLRAQQEQRDKYLRRQQPRFAQAEQALKEGKPDRERARAEATLKERTKVLDRKFAILKQKLNTLPTRKQRLAAGQKSEVEHAAHQETGAKRESPSSP